MIEKTLVDGINNIAPEYLTKLLALYDMGIDVYKHVEVPIKPGIFLEYDLKITNNKKAMVKNRYYFVVKGPYKVPFKDLGIAEAAYPKLEELNYANMYGAHSS